MIDIGFSTNDYWLTRSIFRFGLGLVYLIAFINAVNQFKPLLGEHGLLPVPEWIKAVPFRTSPSLFFLAPKDAAFTAAAWLGILLSGLVLAGFADRFWLSSVLVWAGLWCVCISFVNVGQIFYGFGWESILLEAGFIAMFLGPRRVAPPFIIILLLRWLCFRVMFGAGLIKLRGDPCWKDMTCLDYHYQTQPMPNPLSWYFYWGPEWTHRAGVWFNHFAELIVPFGYFLPQPIASVAGILTIVFQALIMISGNLSWLNFLTMILAVPMIDDRLLRWLVPISPPALNTPGAAYKIAAVAFAILMLWLSVKPVRNMISPDQVMNMNFNPLHLAGTYGAFGGVTRLRNEIILEGTGDTVVTPATKWRAYEFRGKPGDPARLPPQVAPYHLRLDWLMWFAAMSDTARDLWFVHLVEKLLEGDRATIGLLRSNPFPNEPPKFIRSHLYRYQFTTPEDHRRSGLWWERKFLGVYFPAVSLDTPRFRQLLQDRGWLPESVSR